MSTKNKKISESFWIDTLTSKQYELEKDIPPHIPKERLQYWDSRLEHSCYYKLLKLKKESRVIRQAEKIILPKKAPFNQISWKIDFELIGESNYLIECKGQWIQYHGEALANFLKLLRLFSLMRPFDFKRLLIVSDKRFKLGKTGIQVHDFSDLQELID